jgi:hypothetical protein
MRRSSAALEAHQMRLKRWAAAQVTQKLEAWEAKQDEEQAREGQVLAAGERLKLKTDPSW